jgi:hypothetical protein
VRLLVAAVFLTAALAPLGSSAATCGYKSGETVRVTGTYVPSRQDYARNFVFAIQVDCGGTEELVTVQRATGNLPACKPQERVEVVGRLNWNRFLMDGHYEINNPSSVTCLAATRAETTASPAAQPASPVPAQPVPLAKTAPPGAPARTLGPSVWAGRYQDSRGAGDVTFILVRGASTVSGTWKLRTGGGGPITGLLDETGRRMQLRMENIAPECPGTFEGSAEIGDTSMVATYRGKDCEGAVTDGKLELRPQ